MLEDLLSAVVSRSMDGSQPCCASGVSRRGGGAICTSIGACAGAAIYTDAAMDTSAQVPPAPLGTSTGTDGTAVPSSVQQASSAAKLAPAGPMPPVPAIRQPELQLYCSSHHLGHEQQQQPSLAHYSCPCATSAPHAPALQLLSPPLKL